MNLDLSNLSHLLERPSQPTWYPTNNGQTVFELPTSLIPDVYKDRILDFPIRVNDEIKFRIRVEDTETPDLSFAEAVSRTDSFSTFVPAHLDIAARLVEIFMKAEDLKKLLTIAVYARDRVNTSMFQYAFSVALQHRPDTKNRKKINFKRIFNFVYAGIVNFCSIAAISRQPISG